MTQFAIRVNETLQFQVYATEFARDRRDIGPRFPTPREAIAYSTRLQDLMPVSPLRSSVEEPTQTPSAPSPGSASLGSSTDAPRGRLPRRLGRQG